MPTRCGYGEAENGGVPGRVAEPEFGPGVPESAGPASGPDADGVREDVPRAV
ncbi:MAG TPA: hypothetical protein VGW38_26400 [Chloroflexota bacterium]|nr:hypothetical protein [Chloroflexota bacterium]